MSNIDPGVAGTTATLEEQWKAIRRNFTIAKAELEAMAPGTGADFVSADAGNDLTSNPKFWVGSQAEYEAIVSPDANTVYLIVAS
jgi:hypothetical protein